MIISSECKKTIELLFYSNKNKEHVNGEAFFQLKIMKS